MKLNCIITDDEPVALEIIEDYVRIVPYFNLVATCKDAMETYSALRTCKVDVLFIDIQMPEINGLDFIRSLKNKPFVVFTTAFPNFAIEGFDLDAVDYLLKPISIERFLRAADKICNRYDAFAKPETIKSPSEKKYFFVKSNQDLVKVYLDKILYVESMENYVRIHCEDKNVISFNTMRNIEEMLANQHFLRIHRSYIVNLDKVDVVRNFAFTIGDKQFLTGISYRKSVSEVLKMFYST